MLKKSSFIGMCLSIVLEIVIFIILICSGITKTSLPCFILLIALILLNIAVVLLSVALNKIYQKQLVILNSRIKHYQTRLKKFTSDAAKLKAATSTTEIPINEV